MVEKIRSIEASAPLIAGNSIEDTEVHREIKSPCRSSRGADVKNYTPTFRPSGIGWENNFGGVFCLITHVEFSKLRGDALPLSFYRRWNCPARIQEGP